MNLAKRIYTLFILLNNFDGRTENTEINNLQKAGTERLKRNIEFRGFNLPCVNLVSKSNIPNLSSNNKQSNNRINGQGISDCGYNSEGTSTITNGIAANTYDPSSTKKTSTISTESTTTTTESSSTNPTETTPADTTKPASSTDLPTSTTEPTPIIDLSTIEQFTSTTTTKTIEPSSTTTETPTPEESITATTEPTTSTEPFTNTTETVVLSSTTTELTPTRESSTTTTGPTTTTKPPITIQTSTTQTPDRSSSNSNPTSAPTEPSVVTTSVLQTSVTIDPETTASNPVNDKECKESQVVGQDTISWEAQVDNVRYLAVPQCLDEHNMLLIRTCVDGNFETITNCVKVQKPFNKCPEDLQDTGTECRVVLSKVKYDELQCPYPYLKPFNMTLYESPVWYPARRNMEYGIGEFEMEEFSKNYGVDLPKGIYYGAEKLADANCIALINQSLAAVSCESKFDKICNYHYLHTARNTFCSIKGCIHNHFDKTLECLCASGDFSYGNICIPTELSKPYQYVAKSLCTSSCGINMKFTDTLRWTKSNNKVEVTDWNYESTDFSKNFNNVSVNTEGWSIGNIKNKYRFILCTFPENLPEITLRLTNGNELEIKIVNDDYLVRSSDGYYLHCFSDGAKHNLVNRTLSLKGNSYKMKPYVIKESGQYWCVGFEVFNFRKVVSNKLIVVMENIYPIQVVFPYGIYDDPTSSMVAYYKFISNLENKYNSLHKETVKMKWMKTVRIYEEKRQVEYLIHVCRNNKSDKNNLDEYLKIQNNLHDLFIVEHIVSSNLFTLSHCIESKVTQIGVDLIWPKTPIDTNATSVPPCLTPSGRYVKRYCNSDFVDGARWSDPDAVECTPIIGSKSEVTDELNELLTGNQPITEVAEKLLTITENVEKFEPVDVQLVSSILEKFIEEKTGLVNVTKVVSNVMETKNKTMQTAQSYLNATDKILYNFDEVIKSSKQVENSVLVQTNNVLATIFNAKHNIIGLGLINVGNEHSSFKIYDNMSIEDVAKIPNLEVATIIPPELIEEIKQGSDNKIAITIYLTSSLFNEDGKKHEVAAKNFGVLMPRAIAPYKISLIFKLRNGIRSRKHSCGFWRYGFNGTVPIKGQWQPEHKSQVGLGWRLQLCEFSHVTHFGLLILDEDLIEDSVALNVITGIECALSVFGILGIFATALIFKPWRRNEGNQILIHYGIVSIAQIIFLYISRAVAGYNQWLCILVGSLLHYTVLCQFCWMLFIAYLQYKRYVLVLEGKTRWLLIKACFLSYVLPALPVMIILSFFSDNYMEGRAGLCYPNGNGLIYGLIVPIGIVVAINIIVFARIIYELFCRRKVNQCVEDDLFLLRLRLVFLMFFMLGITWVFGFAAQIFESDFCVYLFSITASIQGFILFMFFIVFNETTRIMYVYWWNKYDFKHFS